MIRANYSDKPLIIDILSNSFDANKSVNFVVKQDRQRTKRIRVLIEYSFELCYEFGEVLLSKDKNACALIIYPDRKRTTFKVVIWNLKLVLFCIGLSRLLKILKRESNIQSNYPTNSLLYLWFIGVKPQAQQKGTGSELLNHIIKHSLSVKRPIYLETSMPQTIDFYKKHGFEIYKELKSPHQLYLLRRNIM